MVEDRFCQSCAMPMGITDEHYGTEADGTISCDYCSYCYQDGKFKKDLTIEDMLKISIGFAVDEDNPVEQVRAKLERILPTLKRWRV